MDYAQADRDFNFSISQELLIPGQLCSSNPQAHLHLKAFARAVLSAWNALPLISHYVIQVSVQLLPPQLHLADTKSEVTHWSLNPAFCPFRTLNST